MTAQKKTITVQVGCHSEWLALERALNLRQRLTSHSLGPFSEYHHTTLKGVDLILFQGGPSKTVAGAACQHALVIHKPDLHLMLGTCGGVSGNPGIGGLMFAARAAQYDCIDRLCQSSAFFYGSFDVHIDNTWIENTLERRGLFGGMIATADQDIDFGVRTALTAHGADVADWESAAVALVCHHNRVPVLLIRGVSDIPDETLTQVEQADSFVSTTPAIMNALAELLPLIAEQLALQSPEPNTSIPLQLDKASATSICHW